MNRFTDTGKWGDPWFRTLSPTLKSLWMYLCDSCDNSGVWKMDWDLASFCINERVDEKVMLEAFNNGKERVKVFGEKVLIVKFIEFQTKKKTLDPNHPYHKQLLSLMKTHGIDAQGLAKGHKRGINRVSKGYGKGIDRVSKGSGDPLGLGLGLGLEDKTIPTTGKPPTLKEAFEWLFKKFPNQRGYASAFDSFKKQVKSKDDWENIKKALKNYLESKRVQEGKVVDAYRWFDKDGDKGWGGWIDDRVNDPPGA